MHGDQPLREHFIAFADTVERDGGSTYPTICRGVAADEEVLSLLDGAPLMQRRPLLLLAAVHFLLLSGTEHPLADFYDTVRVVPRPEGRGAERRRDHRLHRLLRRSTEPSSRT